MLPAFIKIVEPSVPKFGGDPLEFSNFNAAFKVEVDKKEVYDATEKLKLNSCQVLLNIQGHPTKIFGKLSVRKTI